MRNHNILRSNANMLGNLFHNNIEWFGNNMFHSHAPHMPGVPPVNIGENDNEFSIEMAAPGYQKQDFKVSVHKDILTITVEKAASAESADPTTTENNANPFGRGKIYRREFCTGNFSRSFSLPDGVDSTKVNGTYENGILTLIIPKADAEVMRTAVEIK